MKLPFSAQTLSVLITVGLLNLYFFRSWDGLGTVGLLVIFFLLISFNNWQFIRSVFSERWFILLSVSFLYALWVVISRSNDVVQTLAVLTAQYLLAILWNAAQANTKGVTSFSELVTTPFVSFRNYLVGLGSSLKGLAQKPRTSASSKLTSRIKSGLIGILISVPIIYILVSLLSAGDPIFHTYVEKVFDRTLEIDSDLLTRILWSLVLLVAVSPFAHSKLGIPFKSPFQSISKLQFLNEYMVLITLLVITMGLFLAVQWQYIFVQVAEETDLSQFGVATYSEYVTRGFGELQIVAFLLYTIVWIGLILFRFKDSVAANRLRVLQLLLLSEFGIFLLSQFRRVWLYQAFHGMTIVRAYGTVFLLVVVLLTLTLAGRHIVRSSFKWVRLELAALALVFVLLGSFNVEQYLATQHPPTVNHRIDHIYLARLSPDGITGWRRALEHAENVLLNPELTTAEILNEDHRREIAYAGTVVHILQLQRQALIHKYGTSRQVTEEYASSLESTEQRYSELIEHFIEVYPEVDLSSPVSTASTLITNREKIRNVRNQLGELTTSIPYVPPQHRLLTYNYSSFGCSYLQCFLSFFGWDTYTLHEEKLDKFEQTLSYNMKDYAVYKNIDSILPLDILLELEHIYFQHRLKVQQQPSNEQDFSVDVDFHSPLLNNF